VPACDLCRPVGITACDCCAECGFHHGPQSTHVQPGRLARNRCIRCAHRWTAPAGPATECPACRSAYVEWLDYKPLDA